MARANQTRTDDDDDDSRVIKYQGYLSSLSRWGRNATVILTRKYVRSMNSRVLSVRVFVSLDI